MEFNKYDLKTYPKKDIYIKIGTNLEFVKRLFEKNINIIDNSNAWKSRLPRFFDDINNNKDNLISIYVGFKQKGNICLYTTTGKVSVYDYDFSEDSIESNIDNLLKLLNGIQ